MSLEVSNYEKAAVANAILGGEAYVPAETLVLKFFSDTVDLGGVGSEIANAGYVPTEIANNNTNFVHTTTGAKSNAVAITTTELAEDSDEIVSAGLFDEDGELRYRKVFDTPFVIPSGSFYTLPIGALTFTVTSI